MNKFDDIMPELSNKILTRNEIPSQWLKCNIVTFPNSNSAIQNGFRPVRYLISHILALKRIIEGVKSHNLKAIIIFVDFKKAFDSINKEIILLY